MGTKEKMACGFEAINFDSEQNIYGCEECSHDHYCTVCKMYHPCDCGCYCHEEPHFNEG